MTDSPRVLHVNDCADVGRLLVAAGRRRGWPWDLLGPERLRPPGGFRPGVAGRARSAAYVARLVGEVARHDVLHLHYANTHGLVAKPWVPRRPYLLTLHGTDIREQWLDPRLRDGIQRAIDGAHRVYYTNVDTRENAEAARPDAVYRPQYVDPTRLRPWAPRAGRPRYVAFASRWDDAKNARGQLDFVARLRRALPSDVRLEGLDWGPYAADAAALGVTLRARLAHPDFIDWLAGASLVVGQATGILAVSELEPIAMGAPVVVPHPLLPVPAGEHVVLHGEPDAMVEAAVAAVAEPSSVPSTSVGPDWVLGWFVADRWVEDFGQDYLAARS